MRRTAESSLTNVRHRPPPVTSRSSIDLRLSPIVNDHRRFLNDFGERPPAIPVIFRSFAPTSAGRYVVDDFR
ncbi:hypothetical protein DSL92_06875 [Billgrantia gudaonensis]|uniref:Uncharacterized protein n=1 Tax=Billgrantia gudaonensis TaxID=376427 RepID=A0A432JGZ0_9GAMM|nr:hypothetical protein DSL92_06875 [Halomonas gudaonensis]